MANLITTWRQGVQEHLATYFAALSPAVEVDVIAGRTPGKPGQTAVSRRRKPTLCVFFTGYDEMSRDTALATPQLIVRMFPVRSELPTSTNPSDPEPLEEACMHLVSAFPRATQSVGYFDANLSSRVVSVTPFDRDTDWYAEAVLRAYTLRPTG